jgi:LacI family transcriptional regulator
MSDAIAIGAIRGLRDRGLSIPADVSVVGFDDIELAQTTDPPLTTVHQPIRGKGEEAVRLLLSVIAGSSDPPAHRRLATELVIRASTGPRPPTAPG